MEVFSRVAASDAILVPRVITGTLVFILCLVHVV